MSDCIGITGGAADFADFQHRLQRALAAHGKRNLRLIYRDRPLLAANAEEWRRRWHLLQSHCRAANIAACAAAPPQALPAPDGLHLSAATLQTLKNPGALTGRQGSGVSCHTADELAQAQGLPLDYLLVSPVLPPGAHPSDLVPLGMEGLARMAAGSHLPVYALGGMTPAHLDEVQRAGARGIAGITWFWGD